MSSAQSKRPLTNHATRWARPASDARPTTPLWRWVLGVLGWTVSIAAVSWGLYRADAAARTPLAAVACSLE